MAVGIKQRVLMPHRLLITFKIKQIKNGDFADFLRKNEVTRGGDSELILEIKNLSDEEFPGGVFDLLNIRYTHSHATIWLGALPKIPSLHSKGDPFTTKIYVNPLEDGLASIFVKINAKDEQPIEYYQAEKINLGTEKWHNFFYVVRYEDILILKVLKELLRR